MSNEELKAKLEKTNRKREFDFNLNLLKEKKQELKDIQEYIKELESEIR